MLERWSSPIEVAVAGDVRSCYYLHLLCALMQRDDIVALAGPVGQRAHVDACARQMLMLPLQLRGW